MRYRISPDVVWTPSDGEVRLYSARTGEFRTLNSTAAEIWRRFEESNTAEAVAAELTRQYGGTSRAQQALITRDVQEFLDQLFAEELLEADPIAGTPDNPGDGDRPGEPADSEVARG